MDEHQRDDLLREAAELQVAGRHLDAISLLEQQLEHEEPDFELRHQLALVYGGRAEAMLREKEMLGLPLDGDELAELDRLLSRGLELDPGLPDLHWDLAMIAARFLGRFEEAQAHLAHARELGFAHPMMAQLEDLIREGRVGEQPAEPPVNRLCVLLEELIEQARGPAAGLLDEKLGLGDLRTLDEYCAEAKTLIESGEVDVDEFLAAHQAGCGVGGDAGEYALDFLRRVSSALGDAEIESIATHAHLRIVAEASFQQCLRVKVEGERALRRARRCAKRGLAIVEESRCVVDPDLRADLLLALGQTYAHHSKPDLELAFQSYLEALDLKEEAQNAGDVARLRDLLAQMCRFQVPQTMMAGIVGGIGKELRTLELAYEATRRIGDDDLMAETGFSLAEALGQVSQAREAIRILEQIGELPELSFEQRFAVRFLLAARLSEVKEAGWARRAREIGEQQVLELEQGECGVAPQTVWMNLGNFRRECGNVAGARDAFCRARELCPEPGPNEVGAQLGQITMLLAEAEILLGNAGEGERLLEKADALYEHAMGIDKLQFESLAARHLLALGKPKEAALHADRGIATRKLILDRGPDLIVWENMLREWNRLDLAAVQAHHQIGGAEALGEALTIAEATKGRLFEWLTRARWDEEAAARALDPAVQDAALEAVRAWAAEAKPGAGEARRGAGEAERGAGEARRRAGEARRGAGARRRWVVSLFAHREGLSVIGIGPGGALAGAWLDDVDYDDLRLRIFDHLENGIDEALAGASPLTRGLSGAVVELLLARIGTWLSRALPELAQGGEELVLLPHRLFRSLPLSHVELPSGGRLSELFDRVTLCASLAELGNAVRKRDAGSDGAPESPPLATRRRGLVDPDRSLPFARIEGLAALGSKNVSCGEEVSVEALQRAFAEPGSLLLSCHGDFDEANPWQSKIHAADGDLDLAELMMNTHDFESELVVLGVCEAGKARRSLNDEPLSFPTFLVKLGAGLVMAPLWKVDDFASFLFVRRFHSELEGGEHPARALGVTAGWLRGLTAKDALAELDGVAASTADGSWGLDEAASRVVDKRMAEYRRWLLEDLEVDEYPFDALDWSAFQLFGYRE